MKKISWTHYLSLVGKICKSASKDFRHVDYIVPILRGGAIPGIMMSHKMNRPCWFIQTKLYDEEGKRLPGLDMQGLSMVSLKDASVIIVDDIVDSGTTMFAVKSFLEAKGASVAIAVVFAREDVAGQVDIVGQVLKSKEWIEFPYEK